MKEDLVVRLAVEGDEPYLIRWLSEPGILRWFPMCDQREVLDAVRLWMSFRRLNAVLTVTWKGVPCGCSVLYVQPYKKLAHQCLFAVIVDKELRGKGAGTFLLQELMKHAKEVFHIEILHLEVYEGNPAFSLYQRLGFETFGFQKNFLKENGSYVGKTFMQKVL